MDPRKQVLNEGLHLVPQCTRQGNGVGPVINLGLHGGKLLVVTLGINSVLEHEGLILSIRGSGDEFDFTARPVIQFPEKCYCGIYTTFLDLTKHPTLRYLRAEWTMNRWGLRRTPPTFSFHVEVREPSFQIATAVA